MAELRPVPLSALAARAFEELDRRAAIFDLPAARFFLGSPDHDLSVRFHGEEAATPLGPAAGPQSQLAQNLVLSWLAGCRILELKTVQVNDRLDIPRPCIDMRRWGYNVEWSQELRLEQSLEEYVKGAMLVEVLRASGRLDLAPGFERTIWDMSVGYDLAGIRSPGVQAFLDGMRDCSALVDRLRPELPRPYRDLDFPTRLSGSLTLSTFHGCPPDEIERIVDWLLRERGLHCVVKLNPMLLGRKRLHEILHDQLGYTDVRVPDSAFTRDTTWPQMIGFVERLGATAKELGLGFGVKFTNTLIVENPGDFLPAAAAPEQYLSGPPLHQLAMHLVMKFRWHFADRFPISFSAGIDRKNFADAVALGLVPVTVCSDLLRPGGYARARGYFEELLRRMDELGARRIGDLCLLSHDLAGEALDLLPEDPATRACYAALERGTDLLAAAGDFYETWVRETCYLNTEEYTQFRLKHPRYRREHNERTPKKIGSALELLDCISCDKCVPVCPNDANFVLALAQDPLPILKVRPEPGGLAVTRAGELAIERPRQFANFADFCNDCGNCDVFCPEDGGPYLVKPRFFGSLADWRAFASLDGFFLERADEADRLHARLRGEESVLEVPAAGPLAWTGAGFALRFDRAAPEASVTGTAEHEVDLTPALIFAALHAALRATGATTWPGALAPWT